MHFRVRHGVFAITYYVQINKINLCCSVFDVQSSQVNLSETAICSVKQEPKQGKLFLSFESTEITFR